MADAKPAQPARKKVTIPMLVEKMKKGEPIVQLAVYDYETAIIADRVGIDILCVSDTGGMVLFGHETTTSVSLSSASWSCAGCCACAAWPPCLPAPPPWRPPPPP